MDLTRQMKIVSVELLAEKLAVSGQTIRRDINHLCDDNQLRRRHGGAELFEQQLNTTYQQRSTTNLEGKRAVAVNAARKIPDNVTIFISIGTTPMMVADALRDKKHLTIVTNNRNAAMALSHEVTNRIILPGGEMRLPDRDIQSEEAVSIFSNYRADFGIFGVFPTTGYGHAHNLHPELVAKIKTAFFTWDFDSDPLYKKEFAKADRFIGIRHKNDWAVIRQIDAANGVSYDCK